MMKLKALIIILFCGLFSAGFAAISNFAYSYHRNNNKEIIMMQRGGCFGACPQFTITIYSSGLIIYEGERNVEKIGTYQKKISKAEVNKLVKEFRNARFFDFNDEYASRYADLPETIISFTDKGKTKKIRDVLDAPEPLKRLEKLLDNISEQADWVKVTKIKN